MRFCRRALSGVMFVALVGGLLVLLPHPAMAETIESEVDRVPAPFDVEVPVQDPFAMVAVSWHGASVTPPPLDVFRDGHWQPLFVEEESEDFGPDASSVEAAEAVDATSTERFSEPVWVGEAEGYRIRHRRGVDDAAVHLIRNRTVLTPVLDNDAADAAPAPSGAPPIHSRADWGASAPTSTPSSATTLKMAVVHHTAGTNDYSAAQVPGIIKGIQSYHQQSRGWNDIGYNFLVDKFGRIWEGRGGGIGKPVIGAHASGFNTGSVGVSLLGTFSSAGATPEALNATSAVIGWKFSLHGVDANGTTTAVGSSDNKFPNGQVVTLPTIVGHQDVGQTDCPGRVQSQLPSIRNAAAAARVQTATGWVESTAQTAPDRVALQGWGIDTRTADRTQIVVTRNGTWASITNTDIDRPDVRALYPGAPNNSGFAVSVALVDGPNELCTFVAETTYGALTRIGCVTYTADNNPRGYLDAVTLTGSTINVQGWAWDPNAAEATPVHVYVNGVGAATTNANVFRPDVEQNLRAAGPNRGFATSFAATGSGPFTVCAYAINLGAGSSNAGLGCRTVGANPDPIGEFVVAGRYENSALVVGWALDPDTTDTIGVLFFNNDRMAWLAPAMYHWDPLIGRFPSHGTNRLFFSLMPINRGSNNICAYALNVGPGNPATFIGCQTVVR